MFGYLFFVIIGKKQLGGNPLKKISVLLFILICLTGCSSVELKEVDTILAEGMTSNIHITNVYRKGYKYYLPKGLKNIVSQDYNEVIYSNQYAYYLYVDVVSYFNKVREEYQENNSYYYSKALYKGNQFGYLQIKSLSDDKYFIEIMYNYAKIEVIVTEKDIKESIAYAIAILESVTYNDTVLGSLMGDNILSSNELEFNIFDTAKTESNYLEIVEQYDFYQIRKVQSWDY